MSWAVWLDSAESSSAAVTLYKGETPEQQCHSLAGTAAQLSHATSTEADPLIETVDHKIKDEPDENFASASYSLEDSSSYSLESPLENPSSSLRPFTKRMKFDEVYGCMSRSSAPESISRKYSDCDAFGRVVGNKLKKMTDTQREYTENLIMEALFLGSRKKMTATARVSLDDSMNNE